MIKALIIGSGPSARQYTDYPYKANGWKIICVNHGWQIEPDMDLWVTPANFKDSKDVIVPENVDTLPHVGDYGLILNNYGTHTECGYSMTLAAGYCALWRLKPSIVAFLGCDMNYTLDAKGRTCIYGIGADFKQHGISDPDRMVEKYGDGKPDYLKRLYGRFEKIAEENLCKVFNLSTDKDTRLPYSVTTPEEII